MAWLFQAILPDGTRLLASYVSETLAVEPMNVERYAHELLAGPLYPTPTSPPAEDPDVRAALATIQAAALIFGPAWGLAEGSWEGDEVPWPDDELPDGARA